MQDDQEGTSETTSKQVRRKLFLVSHLIISRRKHLYHNKSSIKEVFTRILPRHMPAFINTAEIYGVTF